jgi:hypothetical protein
MFIDDELFTRVELDRQDSRLQIDIKIIAHLVIYMIREGFDGVISKLMEAGFIKGHDQHSVCQKGQNAPWQGDNSICWRTILYKESRASPHHTGTTDYYPMRCAISPCPLGKNAYRNR